MRHAPAPADHCAYEHRNANRETNQVADGEQQEGQREIKPAHGTLAADSESLRDVAGEHLRGNDDCKHSRNDRSP